jgi:hypothetical protein
MAKQLHLGIEIDLYYPIEYPCIFFYLDYIYNISEKNAANFFKNFDRNYVLGTVLLMQLSTKRRWTIRKRKRFRLFHAECSQQQFSIRDCFTTIGHCRSCYLCS